jgi:hypothetical protein
VPVFPLRFLSRIAPAVASTFMKREELEAMLNGEELVHTVDVKTLVLDLARQFSQEEILELFWRKLPDLEPDWVRGYFYMKRY